MFDPATITIAELAERWGRTPSQILEYASHGNNLPLYFSFEGLVFAVGDEWHKAGGDSATRSTIETTEFKINQIEENIKRLSHGEIGEYEFDLGILQSQDIVNRRWGDGEFDFSAGPSDAVIQQRRIELRRNIDAKKLICRNLLDVLELRNNNRIQRDYRGLLRAAPGTLWNIVNKGEIPFPNVALHPASTGKLRVLSDKHGPGEKYVSDELLVSLEPMTGHAKFFRDQLTVDDLCVVLSEVKAIEKIIANQPTVALIQAERHLAETKTQVEQIAQAAPASDPVTPAASGKPMASNKWDKHRLQRLLSESEEPGMTQEKLGKKYGMTRQRIAALLKKAKPKKPDVFSAFVQANSKK